MYSLLLMTISGSVLALLLMCLRYTVLRKMPSTVYYYAWLLVLLRFTLPLPGLIPATGATTADTTVSEVPAAYSEIYVQENPGHVSGIDHGDGVKIDTAETTGSQVTLNETETHQMTVSEAVRMKVQPTGKALPTL